MSRARRLRDVGEHGWLARVLPGLPSGPRVLIGPGDDAAVLRAGRGPQLVTVDALIEGVHFRRAWATPRALGRRTFRVGASDLAAMGARPTAVLLALECPPARPAAEITSFVGGLAAEAGRHGAALVGGNLSAGPRLGATVTVLGEAPGRILTREGARVGHLVVVTGTLGASAAAVRALRRGRRVPWPLPPDRLAAGALLARHATAMIDLSDGLLQDLGHVCRASGVGARIDVGRLPVAPRCVALAGKAARGLVLAGGGDYELLATVPAARWPVLRAAATRVRCRLTAIGEIVAGQGVAVHERGTVVRGDARGGWDHFARPPRA
jgi:thiamine-monophosphate kinase